MNKDLQELKEEIEDNNIMQYQMFAMIFLIAYYLNKEWLFLLGAGLCLSMWLVAYIRTKRKNGKRD